MLIVAVVFCAAASSAAAVPWSEQRTIVVDAVASASRSTGPAPGKIGHVQSMGGTLRDGDGRAIGTFDYRCQSIDTLAHGDVREHCSGHGRTADGTIGFAGRTHAATTWHLLALTGGTRAYQGATGTALVRDVSEQESVVTIVFTHVAGQPRAGLVPRSAANLVFRDRANTVCSRAAADLARLPLFPFNNFEPAHPNPTLLPKVGQFFTGPGDPRPILRRLARRLRSLGSPPAQGARWRIVLAAGEAALAARQTQDEAALAANAIRFAASVQLVDAAARRQALAAAAFGAQHCAF